MNMVRHIAFIAATSLLLGSCGQPESTGRAAGENTVTSHPENESHCYLQVTKGAPAVHGTDTIPGAVDTLSIKLDVLGELANGTYNWHPQEKDRKSGSFTGTLENGTVTALLTYTAEGITAKEEVLFKLETGGLRVGTGQLVQSEGVWLFKDKSQVSYGNPLREVPCK